MKLCSCHSLDFTIVSRSPCSEYLYRGSHARSSISANNNSTFHNSRLYPFLETFRCPESSIFNSLERSIRDTFITLIKNTPRNRHSRLFILSSSINSMALSGFQYRIYPQGWILPGPATLAPNSCVWRRPICNECRRYDNRPFSPGDGQDWPVATDSFYCWEIIPCPIGWDQMQRTGSVMDHSPDADHVQKRFWFNGETCEMCVREKEKKEKEKIEGGLHWQNPVTPASGYQKGDYRRWFPGTEFSSIPYTLYPSEFTKRPAHTTSASKPSAPESSASKSSASGSSAPAPPSS
jgi:hypothetical protein